MAFEMVRISGFPGGTGVRVKILFVGIWLCLTQPFASAQQRHWDREKWNAQWIAVPNEPGKVYGVYHFRKSFHIDEVPDLFSIHVSADNKYKLYVNGTFVGAGPQRSDVNHWYYDTRELAPYLRAGENVIAAVVWNHGKHTPEAQQSIRTGFILQGDSPQAEILNTDATWKAVRNDAYQPLVPQLVDVYYVAGPGETVDFASYPDQWDKPGYNDAGWQSAQPLSRGLPKGVFDWTTTWMLVPNPLPSLEFHEDRLRVIRDDGGLGMITDIAEQKLAFRVRPHQRVTLLLDREQLTNAYPVLEFAGGKGATMTMGYAESLYEMEGEGDWQQQLQKGHRDEVAGKRFVGVKDSVVSSGAPQQTYIPLSWRTYRYLQLTVQTAEEALTIDDVYGIFTGYPFQFKAEAHFADTFVDQLLAIGWRTARLCAVDTYMDTPYYEQLQYVGDARIQGLVSLFNSSDGRLLKNAIEQINRSRIAEGITLSRYPTATPQYIPPFSLWWIGMVHDYWMYVGDEDFIKEMLPGVRQVLSFFQRYQGGDGLLRDLPYWTFTDWVPTPPWQNGMPPKGDDGKSSVLDLQLLWAYQLAHRLESRLGFDEVAAHYLSIAGQMAQSIKEQYWSEAQQLFADVSDKTSNSQHANSLAVLTGLVQGEDAFRLMDRVLADTTMAQASIYFKYYVNQAAIQAGHGDRYMELLGQWEKNIAYGLTTWAEVSDVERTRSDCHAWGSSPNIEIFRSVLGIDTDAPGFKRVRIAPHPQHYRFLSGRIPHPNGEVAVVYKKTGDKWSFTVSLPDRTEGVFEWQGTSTKLTAGRNVIVQ